MCLCFCSHKERREEQNEHFLSIYGFRNAENHRKKNDENLKKIKSQYPKTLQNNKKIKSLHQESIKNAIQIKKNREDIFNRRNLILINRDAVHVNKTKVFFGSIA